MDVPAVLAPGGLEPLRDVFVFVRRVVVDDEVHVQLGGDVAFDQFQESQELLVAVPGPAVGENLAGRGVQRGEQRRRAVALVIVGHRGGATARQRQRRLGPLQGLTLGLLVHAQHHRGLRGIQVQPDDIDELGLEVRIVGQLERLHPPRAQLPRPPQTRHRVLADTVARRHGPRRPMRRTTRRAPPQRVRHDRLDDLSGNLRLAPPPRTHPTHRRDTVGGEPNPPRPHRVGLHPHRTSDRPVRHPVGGHHQRRRLTHLPIRQRIRPRHHLQLPTMLNRHLQRGRNHHRHTPTLTHPTI